jgi:cell division protein FtsZ
MSEYKLGINTKVIGVGGAGINAVNHIINAGLKEPEYTAIDFDTMALDKSKAPFRLKLESLYPPLTFPEFGDPARIRNRNSAIAERDKIKNVVSNADSILIIAGLGGGTGSGAAPIVSETARETGALTIGVVTNPFSFEGRGRTQVAKAGISDLDKHVDTLIVIPDDGILKTLQKRDTSVTEVFQVSDHNLWRAVQCIVELISAPCLSTPPSFNESVASLLKSRTGKSLAGRLGTGWASGENRVKEAVQMAITSPLLEEPFEMAGSILILFVCSPKLTVSEIQEGANIIAAASREDAQVIYDISIDNNPKEELYITVVCLYEQNKLRIAV